MQSFIYDYDTPVVNTKQGKVRGYGKNGLSIFKGIPYAKAKRFHAPESADPWDGVLECTSYGFVCPLLDMGGRPNGELLVPHRYWIANENCQNLNVWTPGCDDQKRPVVVWLHGGGFEAGSAIEHIAYEGEHMSELGQVVVVSVNHRLNVLGYFDLSDFGAEYENSGNAGMDDIIAALRWIQENIAGFGGDPDNVTVMGQSGGGAKVTTLLQMPAADGLFHKGVNMSGIIGPVLADAAGSGRKAAEAVMQELHISGTKELETVPCGHLTAAYRKVRPALMMAGENAGCKPHPNAFYLGTPDENGFRPQTAGIPMLIGTVYGEFTSFAAMPRGKRDMTMEEGAAYAAQELGQEAAEKLLPLYRQAYPERNPADLLALDYIFRAPTKAYLRQRSALNDCTWAYLFNLDMPLEGGRTPWHCADIPYFFHNIDMVLPAQAADGAEQIQKQIFDSLMAFVHTGNPNCAALPFWPASTPAQEQTMVFDQNSGVRTNYDEQLIAAVLSYREIFERRLRASMENVQH